MLFFSTKPLANTLQICYTESRALEKETKRNQAKRMKKEWFFDRYCGYRLAALLEDGKLAEFAAERENGGEIVGNIYKGKVMNVLTGMNAAFISCGLDRNCYLSMDETYTDYSKYDGTLGENTKPLLDLKVGDEIIVQVTKPPRGNKGAKVTTHLSFVGKRLIYLPNTDFLGISRKITDETEREKLLKITEKLRGNDKSDGYIIRTKAALATNKQLKKESEYLKKLAKSVENAAKTAKIGAVLYQDLDLPVRVIRDNIGEEITAMHVGDKDLYERLLALVRLQNELPERKLVYYRGERSMFRQYGIFDLIYASASPTVPLENGGYLVIDHTEAMTVVDVNTGSCIGDTSLEETVFAVNALAAKEIARQVRLRNVGGIVVVDFIDMLNEEHKERVTEILTEALSLDKAKCNVLPMSELCLTQFTRKRIGSDTASYLVKPCPHCKGNGHVAHDMFVVMRIRADIIDCFANGFNSVIIELNDGVMRRILSEEIFTQDVKTRWQNKRIYLIPHRTYKEEYFSVRGDNSVVLSLPDNAKLLY